MYILTIDLYKFFEQYKISEGKGHTFESCRVRQIL